MVCIMSIQVNFNSDIIRYININIPYSADGLYARYINYPVWKLNEPDTPIELAAGTMYQVKFPASNEIWFRFSCASNTHGLPLVFVGDRNNATGIGAREDNLDSRPEYFAIILNGEAEDVQYAFPTGLEDTGGWEFVLHFKSGANDGLFEITCRDSAYEGYDPEEIFDWQGTRDGLQTWQRTGNVNNGAPISSVSFLLIAPSWTSEWTEIPTARFGNIVVSDKPIDINGDFYSDKFNFDAQRDIVRSVNIRADVQLDVICPVNEMFDALRQLPYRFSTMAVSEVEIEIATQQVTDRLSFTTVNDVEIMQAVRGRYLDYAFQMRIEKIQRRGLLSTCECCSDIDELLYTQIAYKIPDDFWAKQQWHTEATSDSGESPAITVGSASPYGGGYRVITYHQSMSEADANKQPKALASRHAEKIAEALGKSLEIHIDDFVSTVEIEQGGSTYADMISEIFGWTSRIPTLQINCYLRDDTLFVIQRGYEQNVVDLSNAKYGKPTVRQELIKTFWSGNTWEKTETRTVAHWKAELQPPEFTYEDDNRSSNTNFSFDDDGLVSRSTRDDYTVNSAGETVHKRVETEYEYLTLGSGRKFLYRETTRTYEDGNLTDTQYVEHTPLGQGQSYSYAADDENDYLGSNVGRGKNDDRFNRGRVESIFFPAPEWVNDWTEQQERTIPGITPFDTSFPVYGNAKLIEITDAIKDLNRRTQETVTVDIYDLPHVIDFNDQIVFEGKTYFLERNYVVKTPRIVNKQTVTIIRWY